MFDSQDLAPRVDKLPAHNQGFQARYCWGVVVFGFVVVVFL